MKTVSGNENVEKVQNTLVQQTQQPVQQPALNAVSIFLGGVAQPVMQIAQQAQTAPAAQLMVQPQQ